MGEIAVGPAARIAEVVLYLEGHYAEPCSLQSLAGKAGLSRFHFVRRFRSVTGTSPHQYLIAVRLRAAAERLLSSADPITAIALDVGFNDLSNFNLHFRRNFGMPPTRWRARSN